MINGYNVKKNSSKLMNMFVRKYKKKLYIYMQIIIFYVQFYHIKIKRVQYQNLMESEKQLKKERRI
jgi:hypothetical protein